MVSENLFMNDIWKGTNYNDFLYVGAQGFLMRRLHTLMERPFSRSDHFSLTVEVGAGEGQHLPYVRHNFDRYVMTDIRTPQSATVLPTRVEFRAANAEDLQFEEKSIDRLVSTCVLHHLTDPERALQSWRTMVRPGGVLTIQLSTDPGLVLRLGRHMTTRRAAKKLGLDYDLEVAREHRNHAGGLMVMIERMFATDEVRYVGHPFPWRTWNLNYSSTYQIRRT